MHQESDTLMLWGYNLFISGLLLACIVNTVLVIIATRRQSNMLTKSFAGLLLVTALYSFAYALEITRATQNGALFWLRIEYLGIVWIPFFWIVMTLEYTGKRKWLSRP